MRLRKLLCGMMVMALLVPHEVARMRTLERYAVVKADST